MLKYFLGTSSLFCMDQAGAEGAAGASGSGGSSGGAPEGSGGQAGGEGGAAQSPIPWFPKATADDVTYVQSKGWDKSNNPTADIFNSYRHLEKMNGAVAGGKALLIPEDGADEATTNAFYNKLGRPESVDKYSKGDFEGMSPERSASLKATAHKLGLTEKQLAGIRDWNAQEAKLVQTEMETSAAAEFNAQKEKLEKEWGAKTEENTQKAKEAAAKLGWTEAQIEAMQIALGYDGVIKLAHQIGVSVGEGQFIAGDGGGRGGGADNVMTPAQAKAELDRLSNDKEFLTAWQDKSHARHQEMMNRKSQLSRWADGQK